MEEPTSAEVPGARQEKPPGPFEESPAGVAERVVSGLAKIGLALKSQAWQQAGRRGVTPTQAQILALLRARPGVGMRLSQVAREMAVTAATASDAVAALVAKGLVRKNPSPADQRGIEIRLTVQGRREADGAAGWPDFLLGGVGALDPAEQEVFLRGLVKMIRALQEEGRIPVARMCVTCRFFRPHAHPGSDRPHHCAFVDAPFGDRHLRLDCQDHSPAPSGDAERAWQVWSGGAGV